MKKENVIKAAIEAKIQAMLEAEKNGTKSGDLEEGEGLEGEKEPNFTVVKIDDKVENSIL